MLRCTKMDKSGHQVCRHSGALFWALFYHFLWKDPFELGSSSLNMCPKPSRTNQENAYMTDDHGKKRSRSIRASTPPPPPLKTVTAQITNFHIVQDVTGCQYSSSKNIHGFFLLKSFAIQAITFQAWVLEGYENYLIHGYCRIGLIEWFEITKAPWDQQSDLKFQPTMGSAVWFWK